MPSCRLLDVLPVAFFLGVTWMRRPENIPENGPVKKEKFNPFSAVTTRATGMIALFVLRRVTACEDGQFIVRVCVCACVFVFLCVLVRM